VPVGAAVAEHRAADEAGDAGDEEPGRLAESDRDEPEQAERTADHAADDPEREGPRRRHARRGEIDRLDPRRVLVGLRGLGLRPLAALHPARRGDRHATVAILHAAHSAGLAFCASSMTVSWNHWSACGASLAELLDTHDGSKRGAFRSEVPSESPGGFTQ
jgi:hypothetical protein